MAVWTLQNEIDKAINALIPVIVKGDKDLEAKIAKLGSRIGAFTGWDNRPTVDGMGNPVSVNDTFRLEKADDNHPAGLYARKPDNSDWEDTPFINFDEFGISDIVDSLKAEGFTVNDDGSFDAPAALSDDKFVSAQKVQEALSKAANYNQATRDELAAIIAGLGATYHPKGGDAGLKVVGADADEDTQEFITANQAKVFYTVGDLQAKYDNAYSPVVLGANLFDADAVYNGVNGNVTSSGDSFKIENGEEWAYPSNSSSAFIVEEDKKYKLTIPVISSEAMESSFKVGFAFGELGIMNDEIQNLDYTLTNANNDTSSILIDVTSALSSNNAGLYVYVDSECITLEVDKTELKVQEIQ